jgi:aminomethyltransferase
MSLKSIQLEEKHIALGAKMMSFAGYNMPVRYSSDKGEHFAVRERVGVFDVSHMGEFIVSGPDADKFVQYVTSNDVSKLHVGKVQYSCFPNENGGIVDDLLVYKLPDHKYLLVVNAGNIDKDWQWCSRHAEKFNVTLVNSSDDYSLLAVQGPKAEATLQKLTEKDLSSIPYYSFEIGKVANVSSVIISATGYTGAGGFELYVSNAHVEIVWDALFAAGAQFDIEPIGLGARDTLRLEKGYCLYGNDIDDTTSPLEAGLGWITKLSTHFVGKNKIEKLQLQGVSKRLIGLKMLDKGLARHGYEVFDENENRIGQITSGTISPVLNQGIAMGYLSSEVKLGNTVFVKIRKRMVAAEIVKFPFV